MIFLRLPNTTGLRTKHCFGYHDNNNHALNYHPQNRKEIMNIQDILDASDSSDDETLNVVPSKSNNQASILDSVNVDLEAILYDDESTDESDDSTINVSASLFKNKIASKESPTNFSSSRETSIFNDTSKSTRTFSTVTTNYSNFVENSAFISSKFECNDNYLSHNSEDWAVLQAILQEDDDDDTSYDGSTLKWVDASCAPNLTTVVNKTNLRKQVMDSIENSVDGEASYVNEINVVS
jgi:hypothetical protein